RDFVKTVNRVVAVTRRDGSIAWPDHQPHLHACSERRIQLLDRIREKEEGLNADSHRRGDSTVALRVELRADTRVEIPSQQAVEVAGIRVTKEELLRQHAARRKDPHRHILFVPMLQGRTDVGKYFSDEHSTSITILPDPPLQFLECRRLTITV